MFFGKKIERVIDLKKAEEIYKAEKAEDLEKGDVPALIIAALIVFVPVLLVICGVIYAVAFFFIR